MNHEHVRRLIAKRADTPGAANDLLKTIRILMTFAIATGWRTDDPTAGVTSFAPGACHAWTDDEIEAFEARWPQGTCERTAFALLLCTGQRRSDVVRMAWDDVANGSISLAHSKFSATMSVPLHPDLQAALAAWPRRGGRILVTTFGKPFTPSGFGNFMAIKIALAGLPDRCVTDGLRKAAAQRLAEVGCTADEITAIAGRRNVSKASARPKPAVPCLPALTAIESS